MKDKLTCHHEGPYADKAYRPLVFVYLCYTFVMFDANIMS